MIPLAADRTAREHERRERIRRAARESLVVSWPATGEDGESLLPSFYMDDIGVTDRVARSVGDTTWPLPIAASRGERLARATLVASAIARRTRWRRELDAVRGALSSLSDGERRAYEGLMHAGQVIQLPSEILEEVGSLAGRMSASQAKTIVHCLFEHFGKRRLKLGALGAPQLDPPSIGSIAHLVLAEVGRAGFDPASLDEIFERWWTAKAPREPGDDDLTPASSAGCSTRVSRSWSLANGRISLRAAAAPRSSSCRSVWSKTDSTHRRFPTEWPFRFRPEHRFRTARCAGRSIGWT